MLGGIARQAGHVVSIPAADAALAELGGRVEVIDRRWDRKLRAAALKELEQRK